MNHLGYLFYFSIYFFNSGRAITHNDLGWYLLYREVFEQLDHSFLNPVRSLPYYYPTDKKNSILCYTRFCKYLRFLGRGFGVSFKKPQ